MLPQQQIYNFLKSVTIKFSPLAQYINNTLIRNNYPVNMQDPTTWKYYINMTGNYHPSDTVMYVVSLDTREEMVFSTENLEINPRTKQAYIPGGEYYQRLCDIYPSQVDLIKSILFPVLDIEEAIMAPDFTLLAYGDGYLEEWEQPLIIMELQKFLLIYVERWYFDFLDDEPYFYLTAWGSLWYYLAMVIMSARMEFIRTPYVHSWHIWNKLKANGIQDYSDILDRKKSMLLYQNIDYLKANAGKQSNLIILANNILADFGIGLYGRRVLQETETRAETYQLTPQLEAVKIPTDYAALAIDIPPSTVSTIQSQILSLGLTPSDDAEEVLRVEDILGTTVLNNFTTKFLEIRPISKNTPYAMSLSNFFLETLMVCIDEGYYRNPIVLIEPLTKTRLFLKPAELMALFNYAIYKSLNITDDTIPVQFDVHQSFSTTIDTPVKSFYQGDQEYVIKSFIDVNSYFNGIVYNQNISDPKAFSEMASNLWLKYAEHLLEDQGTIINKKRVILSYLSSLCHKRRRLSLNLVPGFTHYSDWLGSEGINIETSILVQYNSQPDLQIAWQNLALSIMTVLVPTTDIIKAFTDVTLSLDEYNRLTQLFIELCSYRVLFLQVSPETPTFTIGNKWDSVYGPDSTVSYGALMSVIDVDFSDITLLSSELVLHAGFDVKIDTDKNESMYSHHGVGTLKIADTVDQYVGNPKLVSATSSANNNEGILNISHNYLYLNLLN